MSFSTTPVPAVPITAAIVGLPGPVLSPEDADLLRQGRPAGVILFGRNVQTPAQLRALTSAVRAVLPEGAVLMVDQEGGRVARLRPPHWRAQPAAGRIGALHAERPEAGLRAAWLTGVLIGLECVAAGFDTACAPVLDRRLPGMHDIVGDRGYGDDPELVATLGRAVAEGLLAGGVLPVMKHLPGHGRARSDSHLTLPVVEDAAPEDLIPFIRNADLPWAMTAHILFPALDPNRPATLSSRIINAVIRGEIGFQGVLVSDDLGMGALSGSPDTRAVACLETGCDLAMYCAGDPEGTRAVLEACPPVTQATLTRMQAGRAFVASRRQVLDADALASERDRLFS